MENEDKVLYSTNKNKYIIPINLDFDGCVVEHEYPHIGKENCNCSEILKRWIEEYNVGLILHTSRDGDELREAINWFNDKGIVLWGIGTNPTQSRWTTSSKSFGYFIDDMNACMPLIKEDGKRDRVDWIKLCEIFEPRLKDIINKRK